MSQKSDQLDLVAIATTGYWCRKAYLQVHTNGIVGTRLICAFTKSQAPVTSSIQ